MRRIEKYIYQKPGWPRFFWNTEKLLTLLTEVRNMQGRIVGQMSALGFSLKDHANLEILTQDILNSNEIEGEILDKNQVRSSIARRLGLNVSGLVASDRNVDAVVEMMIDATRNFDQPSPETESLAGTIPFFLQATAACLKSGSANSEMTRQARCRLSLAQSAKKSSLPGPASSPGNRDGGFFDWFNKEQGIDLVIKSALAHLWFVTLHPFDDGNGRIARALADMILARSDGQPHRFYSMSAQIRAERKQYYEVLEKTQKSSLDVTCWLEWFLKCLLNAIKESAKTLGLVVFKHNFWLANAAKLENERQRKMLNKLLDGFDGNLTSSKWAKICKCSQDTALRDIRDLLEKQILQKLPGGSRSTAYALKKGCPTGL